MWGVDLMRRPTRVVAAFGDALVITGEGSPDEQTVHRKAPAGIPPAARAAGIAVVAVAGCSLFGRYDVAAAGIAAAYPLSDLEPDPARSMAGGRAAAASGAPHATDWLAPNCAGGAS
jgi:glycerate kinase